MSFIHTSRLTCNLCLCFSNINMAGDGDLEIEEAFRRAQKAHNNKAKLVVSLKNRYNKVTGDLLYKIHIMIHDYSKVWSQV